MNDAPVATQTVVVERDLPYAPEKIWRALTQPHLIGEWLMQNDFKPDPGDRFTLSGDWGSVECKVLTSEPKKTLSYTWVGMGVETVVTWSLTPSDTGTCLRMEQSGFRLDQQRAHEGAKHGWRNFLANLEQLLARVD